MRMEPSPSVAMGQRESHVCVSSAMYWQKLLFSLDSKPFGENRVLRGHFVRV